MSITTDEVIQKRFRFKGRTNTLPWFPKKGTLHDLVALFPQLEYFEGVEVGTNRGKFAHYLCSTNPNLHLTCVDPWTEFEGFDISNERQELIYKYAVKILSGYNITIMRKTSMEALLEFKDESLDFVYIDGNHLFDYVIQDILGWIKKIKKGGMVLIHDYCPFGGGMDVIQAVNAYTFCHHINPWYITREMIPIAYWVIK